MLLTEIMLLEGERVTNLSYAQVLEYANGNYSDQFKLHAYPMFFRGSRRYTSETPPMLINPSKSTRTGTNIRFGYTEIISNLPSWSSLPKRDSALIATGDRGTAKSYGGVMSVIFPNNVSAVVTPTDFWYAFETRLTHLFGGVGSLNEFNSAIWAIFGEVSTTYQEFQNAVVKFCDNLVHIAPSPNMHQKRFIEAIEKSFNIDASEITPGIVMKFLDNLLSPDELDIVTGIDELVNISYTPGEIWTNDPCLVISEDVYYAVITELGAY